MTQDTLRAALREADRIFQWLERRTIYQDSDIKAVHALVRAALAATPPQPAAEPVAWQPIENAPKDGTALLLWVPEAGGAWAAGPWRGHWSPVYDRWMAHLPVKVDGKLGVTKLHAQPTHYHRLPAPPKDQT